MAVIGKYDGFIAQYLGDGILVYFGFPQAQEHAAERAVRAGLEIVEKVGQLKQPDGRALQSRVWASPPVSSLQEAQPASARPERRPLSAILPIWRPGFSPWPTRLRACRPNDASTHRGFFRIFIFRRARNQGLPETRFRSGRCLVRAQSKIGSQPLMPPLPVPSSDASANWHFFITRGSARRKETGTSCYWRARPGWVSRGCWKRLPSV